VGIRSRLTVVLVLTVLAVGPGTFVPTLSPRESYLRTLRRDGLVNGSEGRAWIQAGDHALRQPRVVTLPSRERGRFAPGLPAAVAYAVEVQRGRRLSLAVRFDASAPLFLDLFRIAPDGQPRRVASLASGRSTLSYDVDDDAVYVARLQPELHRDGEFVFAQRTRPSLAFPVDVTPARPQSAFGVARDAGRRRHEGIDLFAARGTPVVAVATGVARPATNRLGGNVVWLHAPASGRTYYYAHLDRWAIGPLAMVRAGDVLGYVGNTGNAARTAPHLHFGVYQRGAIDPWPFVQPDQPIPSD
jgi:murein DD-endopeptidase MepM/ murein hydrolase activator NlpD